MRARETPRCRAPIMRFETPHRVMQRRCPDSVKGGAPTLAKPKKNPSGTRARWPVLRSGARGAYRADAVTSMTHPDLWSAPRAALSEVRPGTYRGPLKSHCCDCMDPRVQQPRLDWSILASAIVEARWIRATAMHNVSQRLSRLGPLSCICCIL